MPRAIAALGVRRGDGTARRSASSMPRHRRLSYANGAAGGHAASALASAWRRTARGRRPRHELSGHRWRDGQIVSAIKPIGKRSRRIETASMSVLPHRHERRFRARRRFFIISPSGEIRRPARRSSIASIGPGKEISVNPRHQQSSISGIAISISSLSISIKQASRVAFCEIEGARNSSVPSIGGIAVISKVREREQIRARLRAAAAPP